MSETLEQRIESTELMLLNSCHEYGFILAGDRSVTEVDAEKLLGYRSGTLRAQRENGTCRIARRRIGNRWRYRVHDLAEEIEKEYYL